MATDSIAPTVSLSRRPPETIALGRDEVHVWRANLNRPQDQISGFLDSLAADERARAETLHFERDRAHFIVARGLLRAILGGYLVLAPERLVFSYGAYGKPVLAGDCGDGTIRFNLSHSGGEALYAVARGREVGVDIERIRPDLAVAEIAERFFSRREVAALQELPVYQQRPAFFRIWTRKEAYIKGRGDGLSLPLGQFDVSLAAGDSEALIETRADQPNASSWSIRDLGAFPGHAAALAVESGGWRLACWQWPGPD
jgi:4'-phosphopantetheinyl transferase